MNDESLKILIEAKDNASSTLKSISSQFGAEVDRMQKAAQNFGNEAKKTSAEVSKFNKDIGVLDLKPFSGQLSSALSDLRTFKDNFVQIFSQLKSGTISFGEAFSMAGANITSFLGTTTGMLAGIGLLVAAFKGLFDIARSGVDAMNEYGTAMGKLEGVAIRFGQSTTEAKSAINDLTDDGLIKMSTAAESLSRLMSQGLNLDDSITLLERYKDVAALGRKETVTMDQAVLNLSQAFATESSHLGDNSGLWENYSLIIEAGAQILGKNTEELTFNERAQAKLLGTMLLTQRAQGDAARAAETYSGKLSQMEQLLFRLRVVIGAIFIPIFSQFVSIVNSGLSSITGWLNRIAPGLVDFGSQFAMASTKGIGAITDLREEMSGAGSDAKKLAQQMEDAMRDYEDSVNKATSNFERSMIQIVQKHDEKVAKITEQIQDEQEAFNEYMSERTATFEDAMLKEETRYAKRTEEINAQIAKEETDYAFRQQQLEDKFKERTEKEIKAYNDRVEKIKQQIRHETVFGGANARERIETYQLALSQEQASHSDRTDEIEKDLQQELAELTLRYTERTQTLKDKLKEETDEHALRTDERQAQFEKETSKRKAELDKRTTTNKNELNQLAQFEKQHQSDFDTFRGKGVEDEITRTKRMHAENLVALEKAHTKQLESIRGATSGATKAWEDAGTKAGSNFVDGMVDTLGHKISRIDWVQVVGGAAFNLTASFLEQMTKAVVKFDEWVPLLRLMGINPQAQQLPRYNYNAGFSYSGIGPYPTGFASGGVVTRPTMGMIGEKGQPEAVIPLNRINDLLPKQASGGDIVVNVNGLIPFTAGQRRQVGELLLQELISAADANNVSLEDLGRN